MAEVKITVRMDGPYWIDGPFDLVDQEGNHFEVKAGERMALCRCGRSNTKPFCDGSHRNETPVFDAPTVAP